MKFTKIIWLFYTHVFLFLFFLFQNFFRMPIFFFKLVFFFFFFFFFILAELCGCDVSTV